MPSMTRREFSSKAALAAFGLLAGSPLLAQERGERPAQAAGVQVLNPRARVPLGLIIDDSTCLVNLNRFAMPQFDEAHNRKNPAYHKPWREWPAAIPDSFVRRFAEWSAAVGVKGKYSIVPYPACVGRLDRELPGWTRRELKASLDLVRELIMPNWDIHPEMVTHTRVIDTRSGHPLPDYSLRSMENWDWTTGKSTDELANYLAYALGILRDAGLSCEGVTTPGGFGNRALPELSLATLQSVRQVFGAEIPHYFRHLYDSGTASVKPRVEYASGLSGPDPRCVVSIIGCTGDWTGGWDCSAPEGADKFITPEGTAGRLVQVIERGEPAIMVCHWTGMYWNGQELGFKVFQEVVRRLHARFDHLIWMKLSELARYSAARELTSIHLTKEGISFLAPFACPNYTVRLKATAVTAPRFDGPEPVPLRQVHTARDLRSHTWCRQQQDLLLCFDLPRGQSRLQL